MKENGSWIDGFFIISIPPFINKTEQPKNTRQRRLKQKTKGTKDKEAGENSL